MFSRIELTRTPCATLGVLLLLAWLPLLAGLTAAAVIVTPIFWPVLALATGMLVQRCREQALMRSGRAIHRLLWRPDGLVVEQRNGTTWTARVDGSSRLFSRWALLKLRPADTTSLLDHFRYRTVWLVHAGRLRNVEDTAFRRLRVALRLSPPDHIPPDQMEGRPT